MKLVSVGNSIGVLSLCAFASVAILQSVAGAEQSKEWKIGALLCMSGACAESGVMSMRGMELAADEINAAGGVLGRKISFVVEDTAEGLSSGASTITAFQKLRQDPRITYFVGPSWTPGGLSVAPIAAKQSEIVMTSPSLGVAEFERAGDNLFNLWPHSDEASLFLARFASKNGWKKAAVFSSEQPWELLQGNTFAAKFKALGGEIVSKQEPLPTTTDLRAECLKILQSKPDVVVLTNFTQLGVGAKQLRQLGYKGPLISVLTDETRIKAAAGALENTIVVGYPAPEATFAERYRARYTEAPGISSDTAYDVVKLYAWAVTASGSFDVPLVKHQIQKAKLPGASGLIQFDQFGGVTKTPILYQIVGGQQVVYHSLRF